MERERELDLLRRLLDLHQRRSTSEAVEPRRQRTWVYEDSKRHHEEVRALLRGRALIAGLACDLPEPGSYFTADVGPVPTLVVRAPDGRARAFLNACRHRGSAVAHGRGAAGKAFACRYHSWTYDLCGKLIARPLADGAFDGLAGSSANLIELPCDEDCGLIVVGTASSVPSSARRLLGALGDEIASHDLASYRFVGEQQKTWPFNWKLGLETFMEAYHIFSLHRDTLGHQLKSAPMLSEFMGAHGRGVVMGRKCPELLGRPESEWRRFGHATLAYWLFPNAVLSMPQSGHAELWTFVPVDDRSDRSSISVRFYAAPTAPKEDEFWQRLIAFTMGVVDAEDFQQQTLIQRNVKSGLLDEIVFGRNEPALIHFHEQLDAVLGTSHAEAGS